jgi:hypothetical protein
MKRDAEIADDFPKFLSNLGDMPTVLGEIPEREDLFMKKLWFVVTLCLILSVAMCAAAMAGTPESPCANCGDTEKGYEYTSNGDGATHKTVCLACDNVVDESCTPNIAQATCTSDKICTLCGGVMQSALGHDWKDATCTTPKTCSVCGLTEGEALGHTWKDATCTTPKTCLVCGATEGEALGHKWEKTTVVEPTCGKKGYTKRTCSVCGKTEKTKYTDALLHWFGPWTNNGDSTHSATCRRDDCGHEATVKCTVLTVTTSNDVLSVCPVCGLFGGETQMDVLKDFTVTNVDKNALQKGESVLFGLEKPFDEVLYALTVDREYGGKPVAYEGTVAVTVPVDIAESFKLVRVDVSDDPAPDEYAETWTDIPCTYENGTLSFETDKAGLFLLVPEK